MVSTQPKLPRQGTPAPPADEEALVPTHIHERPTQTVKSTAPAQFSHWHGHAPAQLSGHQVPPWVSSPHCTPETPTFPHNHLPRGPRWKTAPARAICPPRVPTGDKHKHAEGEVQIGVTNTMKRKGCSGGNESHCSLVLTPGTQGDNKAN